MGERTEMYYMPQISPQAGGVQRRGLGRAPGHRAYRPGR